MKIALILLAAALPALSQQTFDFKSLDKLGARAKETTNISLEGDTLKMATSFLGGDQDSSFVKNLKAVHVRSFEFDKEGQYDAKDLAPVRAYIKSLNWAKIVDVKEQSESTEIYLQAPQNNKPGGLAVVSAEATEVTVIFISGIGSLSDLAKLQGNLGVPSFTLDHGGKKAEDSKKD